MPIVGQVIYSTLENDRETHNVYAWDVLTSLTMRLTP